METSGHGRIDTRPSLVDASISWWATSRGNCRATRARCAHFQCRSKGIYIPIHTAFPSSSSSSDAAAPVDSGRKKKKKKGRRNSSTRGSSTRSFIFLMDILALFPRGQGPPAAATTAVESPLFKRPGPSKWRRNEPSNCISTAQFFSALQLFLSIDSSLAPQRHLHRQPDYCRLRPHWGSWREKRSNK